MSFLKKLAAWVARNLLRLSVILFITLCSTLMIIGTSASVKSLLNKSHIYDNIVNFALDQSAKNQSKGDIPLGDPAIRSIINQALSPQLLKTSTEAFLDGTYKWLDGKSTQPDFRIDLTSTKQAIASGVAVHAVERLKSLPPCVNLPSGDIDPFAIDCRPPIDLEVQQKQIASQMLNNPDFLPNPVLTAANLPKDQQGRTFSEQFARIPKFFHWLKISPYILGLVALVCSAAIVFLSDTKHRGLNQVGKIIFYGGLAIFVVTLVFGLVLYKYVPSLQPKFNNVIGGQFIKDLVGALINKTTQSLLIVSGAVSTLGGGVLLFEKLTRPKQTADTPKTDEKPKIDSQKTVLEEPKKPETEQKTS